MTADLFGWVASVLTTLFAWPQAIRAWRSASTAGISIASTALMFQSGLLWTAYGTMVASPFIVVANASVTAASLLIGIACRARMRGLIGLSLLLVPPLVMALAVLSGATVTGLLGDLAAGLMTVPQALIALRKGASLQAVSPATYALLAINAACWIGYGLAIGDPLVVAPNCVSLPASVLILVRRASDLARRRRGDASAEPAVIERSREA